MIVGYVKKSSSKGSCFTEKMLTESDLVTPPPSPPLSSNTLACTLKQALSKSFRAPAAAAASATPLAGNSMGVDVIEAEVRVSGDSLPVKWFLAGT